jgi:hypothetical protein
MIYVVISLIATAMAILQSEIEQRQLKGADVTAYTKVLHILNAAHIFLRDGDAAGLEATVFAMNRAVDATDTDAAIVIRKGETMTAEKTAKLNKLTKGK